MIALRHLPTLLNVDVDVDVVVCDKVVPCKSALTSQPSEDARLARRQRIVPREELLMQNIGTQGVQELFF